MAERLREQPRLLVGGERVGGGCRATNDTRRGNLPALR